jgi:hypothetical protein
MCSVIPRAVRHDVAAIVTAASFVARHTRAGRRDAANSSTRIAITASTYRPVNRRHTAISATIRRA